MNASNLFGKKVESAAGAEGYVVEVRASGGKIECLVCADEDENEFLVDAENVKKWGETIIYTDRAREIKKSGALRLGLPAYDENGRYLGELSDFSLRGARILKAKIGKKNYPAEGVTCGDAAIVRRARVLKSDVIKNGEVIIKKGTPISEESLKIAENAGEYVQAKLKSI